MPKTYNYKISLQLILAQFFWAGAFVACQLALNSQSVVITAFIRNFLVSLAFFILLYFSAKKIHSPPLASYKLLVLMGISGVFLYNLFVYAGLQVSSVISAALLIPTLQPIATAILSSFVNQEKLTIYQCGGLILGLIGTGIILTGDWALSGASEHMLGNLYLIAAAITFSIYSICAKSVVEIIRPLEATTYSSIIGTLFFLPLLIFDWNMDLLQTDVTFWLSMGYMIFFAGILPFLWWSEGIKIFGATKTGMFNFLVPPFALLLSIIILELNVTGFQIVGAIVGLSGTAMALGVFNKQSIL